MHSHEDGCTRRGFWRAGLTGGLAAALGASRGATAEAGPDARDRLRLKPQADGRGPGGRAGMLAYSDGSWGAGRGLNLHTGSAWQRLNPADVTAYGAKGDGETDDTRAFDRAFAAENAVHVPAGRYVVGPARTDDARPTGEAGMIEVPSGKALILHPGAVLLNGAGKGQYSDPDGRKVDLHLLYVSGHGSAVFGNGATVDDRELPGGRHGRHAGGVVLAGDASECLITDLRVINVGPGRDNAFRVSGRRNVLSRCFAQRRTYAHLFQVVSAGQPCRDCVVEACVADGGWDEYESGQKPDFGRKIGSQDGFRTYGNVHRARFAGCTAYRCRAGFQLWGTHSHGSVIDGCSAYRNFWFGIADLSYEQGGAISGCTAEHNVSYGLYVRSDGATVSGVHLHRNYTREFDFSSPPPHLDEAGVSMSEETPVEFFLSGNRCCITGVTHGVQVGSHACSVITGDENQVFGLRMRGGGDQRPRIYGKNNVIVSHQRPWLMSSEGESGTVHLDAAEGVWKLRIRSAAPEMTEETNSAGQMAVADGEDWDPADRGEGPYPVFWDGSGWKAMY